MNLFFDHVDLMSMSFNRKHISTTKAKPFTKSKLVTRLILHAHSRSKISKPLLKSVETKMQFIWIKNLPKQLVLEKMWRFFSLFFRFFPSLLFFQLFSKDCPWNFHSICYPNNFRPISPGRRVHWPEPPVCSSCFCR
jgi:hypothetical protein